MPSLPPPLLLPLVALSPLGRVLARSRACDERGGTLPSLYTRAAYVRGLSSHERRDEIYCCPAAPPDDGNHRKQRSPSA